MGSNRYFEDFEVGMSLRHATPRTVHGGDLALYIALTGDRRPLASSTELAQSLGYKREVVPDLLTFHLVFGKTVTDISLNAVANLGYADVRFLEPVYPGDTLRAVSEVIGLRQTSKGDAGIVYVTTEGYDQRDRLVLRYHRWVLVPKRDPAAAWEGAIVPTLPKEVEPADLPIPTELNLAQWSNLAWTTGGELLWDDYQVGERIYHPHGMTLDTSEHSMATRLYQNNAEVHFNAHRMKNSRFGERLIYGGHVISVAHALAYPGLENALTMAAWNSGVHANPTFVGDTLYAVTEILGRAELPGRDDLGALRLRLIGIKNANPEQDGVPLAPDGKKYDSRVVLDLDYWALCPRR